MSDVRVLSVRAEDGIKVWEAKLPMYGPTGVVFTVVGERVDTTWDAAAETYGPVVIGYLEAMCLDVCISALLDVVGDVREDPRGPHWTAGVLDAERSAFVLSRVQPSST